jgi:hypothetical protein
VWAAQAGVTFSSLLLTDVAWWLLRRRPEWAPDRFKYIEELYLSATASGTKMRGDSQYLFSPFLEDRNAMACYLFWAGKEWTMRRALQLYLLPSHAACSQPWFLRIFCWIALVIHRLQIRSSSIERRFRPGRRRCRSFECSECVWDHACFPVGLYGNIRVIIQYVHNWFDNC